MDNLPILIPITFLGFALLAAVAGLWRPRAGRTVAITGCALGFALSLWGLLAVLQDGTLTHELGGWSPPLGIEYVLDPLSAFITTVVTFVALAVVVYPSDHGFFSPLRTHAPWLYSVALLLVTGILGVVISGDLFNLFVFLEIYSVSTFALVSLGGSRAAVASFRYLILGSAGSGLYLLGVGFVYFSTGTLNMTDAARLLEGIQSEPQVLAAAVLIVAGLAVKMARFPIHVWRTVAHSYAPPAAAALLAAVQVKAAAYALFRVLLTVFGVEFLTDEVPIATVLTWFSAGGILFGSVMAFRQLDIKRMLAYSTVAQLGFIGLGIGLATPLALIGALLHVLNHALMKSCLFLAAGAVLQETGLKKVTRFGGLGRQMPMTSAAFTVAALSMVGVPPMAGFFSKWYLALASIELGAWAFAVIIVVASLFSAVMFFRVLERIYLEAPSEESVSTAKETQASALAPMLMLAGAVFAVGLVNAIIVTQVLERIVAGL
jgi:multicomponent Na+:H+ antiporter subunit D